MGSLVSGEAALACCSTVRKGRGGCRGKEALGVSSSQLLFIGSEAKFVLKNRAGSATCLRRGRRTGRGRCRTVAHARGEIPDE